MAHELLCSSWPHIVGFASAAVVPTRATLWVCHLCSKLGHHLLWFESSTDCVDYGASWEGLQGSLISLSLHERTMVGAACVGSGGMWKRSCCKYRSVSTSKGLGLLCKWHRALWWLLLLAAVWARCKLRHLKSLRWYANWVKKGLRVSPG